MEYYSVPIGHPVTDGQWNCFSLVSEPFISFGQLVLTEPVDIGSSLVAISHPVRVLTIMLYYEPILNQH